MVEIPRALTAHQRHPLAPLVVVRVDGVIQHMVTAYDCDAGTVERCERTPDGQAIPCKWSNEFMTELVHGNVTVGLT